MAEAIQTQNLTKEYYNRLTKSVVRAVNDLDLTVDEGEIFGFLGPNGAGKTTTIKMLLGLIFPTSGKAKLLGKPAGDNEVKRRIAYLPESPYFYDYMTGAEVVSFYASLFGLTGKERDDKVSALLDRVGLGRDKNRPLRQYSKGMMQRVGVAQALVNDPKLLFLDEPTSGLDPLARIDIRTLIEELRAEGKTVFLSSHQLSDVELICDRVTIIVRGMVQESGTMRDLLKGGRVEVVAEGVPTETVERLRAIPSAQVVANNGRLTVQVDDDEAANAVVDQVRAANGRLLAVTPQRLTLEDLFVKTVRAGDDARTAAPAGSGGEIKR